MLIGNVSTGEPIYFDDSPFDTAYLKIPQEGIVWDMTGDMGNGNALTMQPTGTANMTNQPDWAGGSHFNHSNSHQGQGNLIVLRDSNTAKLAHMIYNAINPLGDDGQEKAAITVQNAKKLYFTVEYFNSSSKDQNGRPHDYAIAEGCFFNNPAALQVSNGSNNAQNTETWTYLATTIHMCEGDAVTQKNQPASQFQAPGGDGPTPAV